VALLPEPSRRLLAMPRAEDMGEGKEEGRGVDMEEAVPKDKSA
jgi:hypothetical protein